MSLKSRMVVVVASLLIVSTYFFPLWQISLKAPQYPEGLAIQIWLNKVTGDVRNINVLNHYIGIAKIEPDHIPELSYFKYVIGVLAGLGILAAISNKRLFVQFWCCALLGSAVLGLYDFYRWEYNYGHNLSPDAPMQLEESYQPPLLGEKQLANITAFSWPKEGGYAFSGAALLAFLLLVFTRGGKGKNQLNSWMLLLIPILTNCSFGGDPEAIQVGRDECKQCRMIISDGRYGGEIVTAKGKSFKFDSLDCLINYQKENQGEGAQVYVENFANPGKLIKASDAVFVFLEERNGPMESNQIAFESEAQARQTLSKPNLAVRRWEEILRQSER